MIRTKTTFADLAGMEPRLSELEADVRRYVELFGKKRVLCANEAWYGYGSRRGQGFKARVSSLAGFDRMPVGFVKPASTLHDKGHGRFRFFGLAELVAESDAVEAAIEEFLRSQPIEIQERERLLRTPTAYDVAYDFLLSLLPACRRCSCC